MKGGEPGAGHGEAVSAVGTRLQPPGAPPAAIRMSASSAHLVRRRSAASLPSALAAVPSRRPEPTGSRHSAAMPVNPVTGRSVRKSSGGGTVQRLTTAALHATAAPPPNGRSAGRGQDAPGFAATPSGGPAVHRAQRPMATAAVAASSAPGLVRSPVLPRPARTIRRLPAHAGTATGGPAAEVASAECLLGARSAVQTEGQRAQKERVLPAMAPKLVLRQTGAAPSASTVAASTPRGFAQATASNYPVQRKELSGLSGAGGGGAGGHTEAAWPQADREASGHDTTVGQRDGLDVDRLIEVIEERVLAEVERRGGRYRGVF